jgi:F0F1-type ATP synthase assembly protein I
MEHRSHVSARPHGQAPTGGELAGLSLFLAAAVVIPLVAGIVLDNLLQRSPLFLFLGLLVGIIGGVAVVYTRVKQYL